MAFSLTWGWGAPPPSKGKGHGNEVVRLLISRTPLNLNINESNNEVFVKMSFQGQNTSPTKSLFTSFLEHVLHLFHMILKFSLHSWQVPRSSVGRALYRERGPSQDGDPVPGDLPFYFVLFCFFCLISFLRSFWGWFVPFPTFSNLMSYLDRLCMLVHCNLLHWRMFSPNNWPSFTFSFNFTFRTCIDRNAVAFEHN